MKFIAAEREEQQRLRRLELDRATEVGPERARLEERTRIDKVKLMAVVEAVESVVVPELPDTFRLVRKSIQMILDNAAGDILATIDQM